MIIWLKIKRYIQSIFVCHNVLCLIIEGKKSVAILAEPVIDSGNASEDKYVVYVIE